MKVAFIVPVLDEINLEKTFNKINEACEIEHDIYFAINGKLNSFFTQVRTTFLADSSVKAFMVDRPVNEHKLITLGMEYTEDYDATIIYSGKELPNVDIIKAFIASWQAGNKIVYLKKEYSGLRKLGVNIKRAFYQMGVKTLGIFKDRCAETDIQLLDQDVVKTINQLPQKNRQLRVLDSFVGYPTDIIQIELDNKSVENKLYEEKSKNFRLCGMGAVLSLFISLALIAVAIAGFALNWQISSVFYITFIVVGVFGLALAYIFVIKRTLNYRIGEITDMNELRDLSNKIEKYNITNKK